MEESLVRAWLRVDPESGSGNGSGNGSGYGDGDGYGYGNCNCDGPGNGSGYGAAYGYGYGNGSGNGSGYGHGRAWGDGQGWGDGDGHGRAWGDGQGYGDGYGYGYGNCNEEIKTFEGQSVFYIDNVPTLIYAIMGDLALGEILDDDFSLRKCYVARCHGYFAHGYTPWQAITDAEAKWIEVRPLDERLDEFVTAHPDLDTPYDDLFAWHHALTGSCTAGREQWCRAHDLNPTDSITVRYFIENTRNDYGGDAIRQLAERYGMTLTPRRDGDTPHS